MRVVITGAGVGGLAAAALLGAAGVEVTVCEAAATPGGKLREAAAGDARIDAGPTVFTLRPVFEAIFADAGARLDEHLTLEKLDCLARHFWEDGSRLDLFAAATRNAAAISDFADAAAAFNYTEFARRSQRIFETLDANFMQAQQPGLAGLVLNAGPKLLNISPFATMWSELGRSFTNPRLRQLFGRYATYCGSSPFTAPATLMLVAHAEMLGVWRVKGGMFRLAEALAELAAAQGAVFRYHTKVAEILTTNSKASGVRLADGETVNADAVIVNADLAALDAGYFGAPAKQAVAGMMKGAKRSLSAVTWVMTGTASGAALSHHNVFFANDYAAEFAAIGRGKIPKDPTVYVCAPELGRFFCLINAPANGDAITGEEECLSLMLEKLRRCGVLLTPDEVTRTGPREFATMFPATGGALYGRALTGWKDSFARPGAMTKLPGLYLAGGSVHPGPGLPMAALSGRLAAQRLLADFGLTRPSRLAATPGGMLMRSAMTETTR
jgi:1-hydroxycarotenoid 3,4-desaturase